jgi:hypothetical protein
MDGRKVIAVGDQRLPQVPVAEEAIGEETQIHLRLYLVGEVVEAVGMWGGTGTGTGTDVYHRHEGMTHHHKEAVGAIAGVAESKDVLVRDQDHVAPFPAEETRAMINSNGLPLVSYCANSCDRAPRDVWLVILARRPL